MRRGVVAAVVAFVVAAAFLAACSSSKKDGGTHAPVDLRGRKTVDIDAKNNLFDPDDVIVSVGTTVTWHNRDTVAHDIVPDAVSPGAGFGIGLSDFGPGATYSFTFATAGKFIYHCSIHGLMTGRVQVVAQ